MGTVYLTHDEFIGRDVAIPEALAFHIIVDGEVNVRKSDKNLDVLDRVHCFGEMGFIAGVKRPATIVVRTNVIVMKVTSSFIDKASLNCQPRFKNVFLNTMVRCLSNADEVIAD